MQPLPGLDDHRVVWLIDQDAAGYLTGDARPVA
jgi:hypothetical protein